MSLLYRRKKVFIWTHGWYGKEKRIEKILKKIMFHLPNGGVFCYGNYARNLMIKEGFNSKKIFVIHNSLFYDKQIEIRNYLKETCIYKNHFNNGNKNLFFVGRLTAIKKLDLILKAIIICRNRGTEYNLTFIGDGERADELKSLTKRLGIENQVWFYGSCYDEKELSSLIYNADLCVAPGNIGLTAMHSMVFGTPCLTHNDYPYQMPEFEAIKEGKTGTFFKRDDVNDLANKIDDWFKLNGAEREVVRKSCMDEIDREWNPYFQIEVLKKNL
jgi:glycosyltransferase involved in cell wall biosynthesis